MKVNLRIIIGILCGVAMVSCTSTVSEPNTSQTPIQFGTSVSRAAVNSASDMTAFSVWGGYDNVKLFEGTKVNNTASGWTYEGGDRYWVPGKTFNFYAVHPVFPDGGPVASVASDGTISVTNFDCSKTGTEAIDFMTARNIGIPYTGDTPPSPVDLKFGHELAKVNFVVKSEGSDVVITNISLIDVGYKGELNNGLWTITSKSIQGTPETFTDSDITLSPDGTILEVFGGDMLLIPLNETDFKCKIELEYKYLYNGIYYESGLKEISLNAGTVKSWDKGGNYKYTITIPKFTEELQLQVEVLPWDKEENASVEW